jgi:hypothetical protein
MPNVQSMPACKIVDTAGKMTAALIQAVSAAGYTGIARYVPLPGVSAAKDIDAAELNSILEAGLGLLLVQHSRYPNWDPTQASGVKDAQSALQYAKAAGYPTNAHIFLDLEGVRVGTTSADMLAFANDWANTIVGVGYSAGCYVGYDVPLNADQLYYDLAKINSYWSDMGPRAVSERGFAIKQQAQVVIGGQDFDPDVVTLDQRKEAPLWIVRA